MIELLGILLLVQGFGGLLNRLPGADSPSWFVQLHVLPPPLHIVASVLMALAGAAVLLAAGLGRGRHEWCPVTNREPRGAGGGVRGPGRPGGER
jgi:hypothetical protein